MPSQTSGLLPKALESLMDISGEIPAFPFTRLLSAWRVTPRRLAALIDIVVFLSTKDISNRHAPDFDLISVFFLFAQIISCLQTEPRVGAAAESLIEPDRHL